MDKRIIRIANRFRGIIKKVAKLNSLRLMVERAFPSEVYPPDMKETGIPDEYEGIIDDHFVLYLKYSSDTPYDIKLDMRKDINGATIKHKKFGTLDQMVRYYMEHRKDTSEWEKSVVGGKTYKEINLNDVGHAILNNISYNEMRDGIDYDRLTGDHYLISSLEDPNKEVYFVNVSNKGYDFVDINGNIFFLPVGHEPWADKTILQEFIKDHPI
jgi:hypothetical protein